MHDVTALEPRPASTPAPARRFDHPPDLATRHLHGVAALLAARADLRGVHAFADVVEESVRWSA